MRRFGAAALLALAPAAFAADAPALRGVETGDLDRSVAPCTDFYEFANGAWRAANPIPPSMVRWSRRWAAGETAKDQLNAILDQVSSSTTWPKGSVEQLIGDHYASCMDEARVEALGLEPIRPLLARDRRPHRHGRRPEDDRPPARAGHPGALRPHRLVGQPAADPGRRRHLRLGPRAARPRLLREERAAVPGGAREVPRPRRARDRAGGASRAASRRAADAVFAMEKQLAVASLDNVALRDPNATDHKITFIELTNLAPDFDWPGYFAARSSRGPRERAAAGVHEGHGPALPRDPRSRRGRRT